MSDPEFNRIPSYASTWDLLEAGAWSVLVRIKARWTSRTIAADLGVSDAFVEARRHRLNQHGFISRMPGKAESLYSATKALIDSGVSIRAACRETGMKQASFFTIRLKREGRAPSRRRGPDVLGPEISEPTREDRCPCGLLLPCYHGESFDDMATAGMGGWFDNCAD